MKKCPSCNIQYSNDQSFCSKCGAKLVDAAPTFEVINKQQYESMKKKDPAEWGCLAFSVISFIVGFFAEELLLGIALAVSGIILAFQSQSKVMKIASYVISGITLLICLLVLLILLFL